MRIRTFALLLFSLAFPACTVRNVTPSDGGLQDTSSPPREAGFANEQGVFPDGAPPPRRDVCSRPPGTCLSKADCKPGQDCKAPWQPDPCCPSCNHVLGTCQADTSCVKNEQCPLTQYCSLDGNCGGQVPGQCKPRPPACTALYAPVCGCDNKTYGNDCVAHSAGVSVQYKGQCCADINKQYVTLVAAAKKCCALCGAAIDPCTMIVSSSLDCPCETSVNAGAPELAMMKTLAQQWTAQGCKSFGCPPMPCPKVTSGGCLPAPGGPGLCVDKFAP